MTDTGVVVWYNPRCSKCRGAEELLAASGVPARRVLYLDDPPAREEITRVLTLLGATGPRARADRRASLPRAWPRRGNSRRAGRGDGAAPGTHRTPRGHLGRPSGHRKASRASYTAARRSPEPAFGIAPATLTCRCRHAVGAGLASRDSRALAVPLSDPAWILCQGTEAGKGAG
jgi:hypothetical protein